MCVCVWAYKCISVHGKTANDGACFCVCCSSYGFFHSFFFLSSLLLLFHILHVYIDRESEGGRGRISSELKVLPIWNVCVHAYVCVCAFFLLQNCRVVEQQQKQQPTMAAYSFSNYYYMVLSMYNFIVIRFRHYLIWYSDLIPMNTIRCIQFQLDTHIIHYVCAFFSWTFLTEFNLSFNLKICFSSKKKHISR